MSPFVPMVTESVSVSVSDRVPALVSVWLLFSTVLYDSLVVALPFENVELSLSTVLPRSVSVLVGESSPVS